MDTRRDDVQRIALLMGQPHFESMREAADRIVALRCEPGRKADADRLADLWSECFLEIHGVWTRRMQGRPAPHDPTDAQIAVGRVADERAAELWARTRPDLDAFRAILQNSVAEYFAAHPRAQPSGDAASPHELNGNSGR